MYKFQLAFVFPSILGACSPIVEIFKSQFRNLGYIKRIKRCSWTEKGSIDRSAPMIRFFGCSQKAPGRVEDSRKSLLFTNKRMSQQFSNRPSFTRLLLQATIHKAPKVTRSIHRQTWRVAKANRAHKCRPIGPLTRQQERKMTQIQLHQRKPQAPYIPSIPVIIPSICIRVEPLRTHVSTSTNVRITWVKRPSHDPTNPKIGDLNIHRTIHQQIRRFNIPMNDFMRVQVVEST
ncbi:hypothetical protein Ancab_029804 [Ancistrocladus abbreviatus]